jgi:hypothetical protein
VAEGRVRADARNARRKAAARGRDGTDTRPCAKPTPNYIAIFDWAFGPMQDYTKLLVINLAILAGSFAAFILGASLGVHTLNQTRLPHVTQKCLITGQTPGSFP